MTDFVCFSAADSDGQRNRPNYEGSPRVGDARARGRSVRSRRTTRTTGQTWAAAALVDQAAPARQVWSEGSGSMRRARESSSDIQSGAQATQRAAGNMPGGNPPGGNAP